MQSLNVVKASENRGPLNVRHRKQPLYPITLSRLTDPRQLSFVICASFFFFCCRSAVLRPSVHMFSGFGWCGAGLPLFPTACWWLNHPAATTSVSVSARWEDSPGGCGGPSAPLLFIRGVHSPRCQFDPCALAGHGVLFTT